ncbi:MAG: transglycosylase domain-containing protein [Acidobacteriota bacterium]|nr:transglycosylase domain-containing protein [Acidobacteriota bacterium]
MKRWRTWTGPLAGWPRWRKRVVSVVVLVCALAGGVALEIHRDGAYFFVSCNIDRLTPHGPGHSSYLYSADGVRFATLGAPVVHTAVPLDRIDPKLQQATVAVEDRRFYHEGGTDWIAVLRAAVADVTSGSLAQGGSTLTQQLVRNLYLGDQRTLGRKLQEGCLADQLARRWSKGRVLDAYLNTVFYGQQAYGVQAAAETYFSRPARRLTLPQAALLAGLPQAPTLYDPLRDPRDALARRSEVLKAMVANGNISQAAYRRALHAPLGLRPGPIAKQQPESFFVNYVYEQLVGRYGAATVRQGGLAVHTTLDWRWQQEAERAIRTTLDRPTDPASALVAIDPATGAVKAMASIVPGKPNYQFNLAVQGLRQAGSSFKLFVLTDAIERGIDPFTTTYLSAPFRGPSTNPYLIQTDTHTYTGKTPIDQATAQSDNTVFVRLTLDLGDASVAATAHRMGVVSPLAAVDTIGLGVNPVSPIEMASAYATVAARGVYRKPYAVSSVTFPDGRTDRSWRTHGGKQVIPAAVADEVTRVLQEVIAHGTGTAADPGRPAAGKTGTTESLADAWFDGYTPNIAAAVWVGYPQARVSMKNVHGIQVFGGTFPARIWRTFVTEALRGLPPTRFLQDVSTLHWRRWCGRFQYARSYADAGASARCTQTTTRTRSVKTTAPGTTTSGTTVRATTTGTPPPAPTTQQATTEQAPPPAPPPTTTAAATTETTTTAPTTTTPATTTTGG